MEYLVLTAESADDVCQTVTKQLNDGWTLVGGVSVAVSQKSIENERKGYVENQVINIYAQAVSRSVGKST